MYIVSSIFLRVLRQLWGVVSFAALTYRGNASVILYPKQSCCWQSHQGLCYVCRDPALRMLMCNKGCGFHYGQRLPEVGPYVEASFSCWHLITTDAMSANTAKTFFNLLPVWMSTKVTSLNLDWFFCCPLALRLRYEFMRAGQRTMYGIDFILYSASFSILAHTLCLCVCMHMHSVYWLSLK